MNKKIIILIFILLIPFISIVKAENEIFESQGTVNFIDIDDDEYWEPTTYGIHYFNNQLLAGYSYYTAFTGYRFGYGSETAKVYLGLGSASAISQSFETSEEDYYDAYYVTDNYIFLTGSYQLMILDSTLNKIADIDLSYSVTSSHYFYNTSDYYFNILDSGEILILATTNNFTLDNLYCAIASISTTYEVTSLDCTLSNLNTYFPTIVSDYENNLNETYYLNHDNKKILINEGNLLYYEDDELIFEITPNENEEFIKALFLDNYIISLKRQYIGTDDAGTYIGTIIIYDLTGNTIQTITGNYEYLDLEVDESNLEFAVLKQSYSDSACQYGYATYGGAYNYNCAVNISYETFKYITAESIVDEILNPDTKDIAILIFSILLVFSIIVIFKTKKIIF